MWMHMSVFMTIFLVMRVRMGMGMIVAVIVRVLMRMRVSVGVRYLAVFMAMRVLSVLMIVRVAVHMAVSAVVMMVPAGMQIEPGERLGDHGRVQMAAFAGVDLNGGRTGCADAVGIKAGLLVALDHGDGQFGLALAQGFDGGAQQRGFARTGAGDQVVDGDAMRGKVGTVLSGNGVVGTQHIGLQLDGTLLAHAGHRYLGRTCAKVQVTGARLYGHARGARRISGIAASTNYAHVVFLILIVLS